MPKHKIDFVPRFGVLTTGEFPVPQSASLTPDGMSPSDDPVRGFIYGRCLRPGEAERIDRWTAHMSSEEIRQGAREVDRIVSEAERRKSLQQDWHEGNAT